MKIGWRLTVEACALDSFNAYRLAKKAAELALREAQGEYSVGEVVGSASARWEQIELPDVDEGENL